jgi:hypothetical protein
VEEKEHKKKIINQVVLILQTKLSIICSFLHYLTQELLDGNFCAFGRILQRKYSLKKMSIDKRKDCSNLVTAP